MTTEEPTRLPPRQSVPSRPQDRRRIAAVVAMIVILGLAAWLLFLRPNQAAGPPEAEPTPTPTTAPSPTAAVDPQMGDDPVAAFRAIHSKRTLAMIERRPELVDDIYEPTCECYELRTAIEEATAGGEHLRGYDPKVITVIPVRLADSQFPNLASLRVITEQGPFTVISDSGSVIADDPGWRPLSTHWRLVRSTQTRRWTVDLMDVEGTAEDVLGPGWQSNIP